MAASFDGKCSEKTTFGIPSIIPFMGRQKRIEEARGIAEAQKIIKSTLTQNYLQHEAINSHSTLTSANLFLRES